MKNGVGIYCNPAEGQELMEGFNAIVSGLQKQGEQVMDDEAESLRALLYSDAISPQFVRTLSSGVWGYLYRRRVFDPA